MGNTPDEPLTEERLAEIDRAYGREVVALEDAKKAAALIVRLMAEIRRLRSDDWVGRAIEKADNLPGGQSGPISGGAIEAIRAGWRKHRDGR